MQLLATLSLLAVAATATCQDDHSGETPDVPNVVPSLWDGKCFYPTGDIGFELEPYLGRWYQVAGTIAPFTAGCKCIFAEYELNVRDTCEHRPESPEKLTCPRTTVLSRSTTPARPSSSPSTSSAPLPLPIPRTAPRASSASSSPASRLRTATAPTTSCKVCCPGVAHSGLKLTFGCRLHRRLCDRPIEQLHHAFRSQPRAAPRRGRT